MAIGSPINFNWIFDGGGSVSVSAIVKNWCVQLVSSETPLIWTHGPGWL